MQVSAIDHNGKKVIGQFVRHADAFNSVLWVGGEWSIFVLRSSVKPA